MTQNVTELVKKLAVYRADFFPAWAELGQIFLPKIGPGHIAFIKSIINGSHVFGPPIL